MPLHRPQVDSAATSVKDFPTLPILKTAWKHTDSISAQEKEASLGRKAEGNPVSRLWDEAFSHIICDLAFARRNQANLVPEELQQFWSFKLTALGGYRAIGCRSHTCSEHRRN
jgi:hypothetical protein